MSLPESSTSTFLDVCRSYEPRTEEVFAVAVVKRARQIIFQNSLVDYTRRRLNEGVSESEVKNQLDFILEAAGNPEIRF